MWILLVFFVVGVLLGWAIRKQPKMGKIAGWGSKILLGLLIFLMGISTGGQAEIVDNFYEVGFTAFALAMGGIAGSILFSIPASRRFIKREK